jgi:capsular exopolysaccharide synthesis family protein
MAGITAPIIGELPKIRKDEEELIRLNDRSILAESFRIMSANLQYLFVGKPKDNGRVVLVTSTVKGEGKTFISANLAITLANSGSSVILVGGDLRNPQIHRYLAVDKSRDKAGVVEYLLHPEKPLDEFIIESEAYENLSLMFSGTIPPNPAELLMTERVSVLFKDLKARYDYVIVDTAPSMLVADTFLLSDYADSTIYVSRVGYTPKNLLSFVKDKIKQKKLENVAIAINNLDVENLGYGSKYGYSYSYSYGYGSSTRRTLWRRIKDSF